MYSVHSSTLYSIRTVQCTLQYTLQYPYCTVHTLVNSTVSVVHPYQIKYLNTLYKIKQYLNTLYKTKQYLNTLYKIKLYLNTHYKTKLYLNTLYKIKLYSNTLFKTKVYLNNVKCKIKLYLNGAMTNSWKYKLRKDKLLTRQTPENKNFWNTNSKISNLKKMFHNLYLI